MRLLDTDGREIYLGAKAQVSVVKGDLFRLQTPGGTRGSAEFLLATHAGFSLSNIQAAVAAIGRLGLQLFAGHAARSRATCLLTADMV